MQLPLSIALHWRLTGVGDIMRKAFTFLEPGNVVAPLYTGLTVKGTFLYLEIVH